MEKIDLEIPKALFQENHSIGSVWLVPENLLARPRLHFTWHRFHSLWAAFSQRCLQKTVSGNCLTLHRAEGSSEWDKNLGSQRVAGRSHSLHMFLRVKKGTHALGLGVCGGKSCETLRSSPLADLRLWASRRVKLSHGCQPPARGLNPW